MRWAMQLSDNVVRFFVACAARAGIDVFRIFDSLNWVENCAWRSCGAAAASCARRRSANTGNLSDRDERKYTLDYYCSWRAS